MKTTSKEGLLVIQKDGEPIACVRRDESTGHQIFYKLEAMGCEQIEELFDNN